MPTFQPLRKQLSISSIASKKTYSGFSNSNSLFFGLKKREKLRIPKVNISSIIREKAYLYLDEGLAHTFDELLDKGYFYKIK